MIDQLLAGSQGIPLPDVLISSLGTRIHYGQSLTEDDFWADHIDHHWSPQRVRRVLSNLPGLHPQPKNEQTPMKVSYYYDESKAPSVDEIVALLDHWPCDYVLGNTDHRVWIPQAIEQAGQTCHGRFGELEIEGRRIAVLPG